MSEPPISTIRSARERGGKNFLLVLTDGQVATHALPERGEVTIGRSDTCDVMIQHQSISRQHAMLRLADSITTIADLGSSNGTTVRDKLLPKDTPTPLQPNEVFSVGDVTLVLQRRAPTQKARRIWSHDYFEGRIAEECTRAQSSEGSFAIVHLSFSSGVEPADVQEGIADLLRDVDVVAQYGPRDYELLLVDASEQDLPVLLKRIDYAFSARSHPVTVGCARFPQDGRDTDKLLSRARSGPRKSGLTTGPRGRSVVLEDEAMRNLYLLAERIAVGTIHVLILGETGVGKQVLAETIHKQSPRRDKPFLELNCSAFSENLLESELFGHEKGAFTGAASAKAGLLESANGGTVFLDEIGDMALSLQAKLLRALENGEVYPVGGLKPRLIDVRFLAATNLDLEEEVDAGNFRQDLYFRINGVTLEVPPLRERRAEIEALARSFVADYSQRLGKAKPLGIAADALEMLLDYSWPGNIRELRNVIERATLLATTDTITPANLPVEKMSATFSQRGAALGVGYPLPSSAALEPEGSGSEPGPLLGTENLAEKKQRIMEALMACGGNNTEAAKVLGVSRRTLGKWLETYGMPRPRKQRRTQAPED